MGSADEGTDIRVKLDEVALQRLQSGDPCLMPCVDCGFVTTDFCDTCWGEGPFPQDKAHGKFIPLCPRCELVKWQCHFCRREDWCDPPAWWDHHSVIKHALRLPDQGYRQIATGALKIKATQDYEKKIFKNREKQTFTHMEPYLPASVLSMIQSTENARPSSSSTEAPKVIEALFECASCGLKSKQKYRCKPCASKAATLSKTFKPPQAFENLADDEKVAFWRSDSSTKNK